MSSEIENIENASLIILSARSESDLQREDIESVVYQIAAMNSVNLESEDFIGIVGGLMKDVMKFNGSFGRDMINL